MINLEFKLNSNIQSTLEKMLEKQLKQHVAIDTLQKNNEELKYKVSEIKNFCETFSRL